jgi:Ca-activated chloride channel family protein
MFAPSSASPSNYSLSHAVKLLPLFICVLFPVVIVAQDQDDEVVRFSTDLSVYPVRIRTRNRSLVPKLTEDDFALTDPDGVTTSSYFAAGADRVALVFALDESGSLQQILSQQREAAIALFERFNKNSRVAVLRFSDRPSVIVPFGKEGDLAKPAFDFRARRDTRTAIFDAAAQAVKMFEGLHKDPAERRIVILISDGLDNSSATKSSSVIAAAQANNISFYTIQIPLFEPRDGRLVVRGPSAGFRNLADKTGGKYFLTADAKAALDPQRQNDLVPVFSAIEEDLKSQYVIGFYVGDKARDDRPHKISITLKRPNLEYSVAQYGFSKTHHFSVKLAKRNPGN